MKTPCRKDPPFRADLSFHPSRTSVSRRFFLKILLGLPFFSFFPLEAQRGRTAPPVLPKEEGQSIGQSFDGEELVFDGGFWMFRRVAVGKLSFKKSEEKGRYIATLQGETLGILGLVARYRVDTYRSIMEEVDGGKRLRSVSFEEEVTIGEKRKKRTHLFDYQKRKWIQITQRYERFPVREEEEIPPGMIYDDFITGFYNFRYGAYGKIERGRRYTVSTFPKKGPSSYEVWIASQEEEEEQRKSLKVKAGREYRVKLYLGPELTRSKDGMIEGWLSKDIIPLEGMIRDVILYGDVKARLVKSSKLKAES